MDYLDLHLSPEAAEAVFAMTDCKMNAGIQQMLLLLNDRVVADEIVIPEWLEQLLTENK